MKSKTKKKGVMPAGADKRQVADKAWHDLALSALTCDMTELEREIDRTSLDTELEKYNWPVQVKRWIWNDRYYKGLAAYCQAFGVRSVLDLGTCTGASAVCLAKCAQNVLTCDLTDWSVADPNIFDDKIKFHRCVNESDVLDLDYTKYDLVFVDIGHTGLLERLIHQKLTTECYVGDVFWDDIYDGEEMRKFWQSVDRPKLELDWHSKGFGVVRYGCAQPRRRPQVVREVVEQ